MEECYRLFAGLDIGFHSTDFPYERGLSNIYFGTGDTLLCEVSIQLISPTRGDHQGHGVKVHIYCG